MLETHPGGRVTTAVLAAHVGVSEAALYRHFPSKARMIDGLIEFAETTLFSRIAQIATTEGNAQARCGAVLLVLLTFCERNPGIARLFAGDAMQGETNRLRARMRQLYDRIETQLRQFVRDDRVERTSLAPLNPNTTVNLLLASAEGRINQFVRSEFKAKPTKAWQEQWRVLATALF